MAWSRVAAVLAINRLCAPGSELAIERRWYRRLVAAFQWIFGDTIFFGTDTPREHAAVVHRARFSFMSEARIWYSRDPGQRLLPGDCQNVIVLSDEFYREIRSHPIPADLDAAKALSSKPGSP